ncbi:MAG: 6-carboxytetrahydropterin synthase QueD [Planctomycetota bacterium]
MYELTVKADFSAAHRLRDYEGACERLHGHNYKVDVVVAGERLDEMDVLVDFRQVKAILADVLDAFDHRYLNEVAPFDSVNPTAENIAKVIADRLADGLPDGVAVRSVTAWESDRCGATYAP